MANVTISTELFSELVKYFVAYDDEARTEHEPEIRKALQVKWQSYARRQLYTKAKSAGREAERQAAIKQYTNY